MRSRSGLRGAFTLLELLIVVTVIAILASIITRSAAGIANEALANKATAGVKSIEVGIQTYFGLTGEYPGQLNNLAAQAKDGTLSASQTDKVIALLLDGVSGSGSLMDPSALSACLKTRAGRSPHAIDYAVLASKHISNDMMVFGYEGGGGSFKRFTIKYNAAADKVSVLK